MRPRPISFVTWPRFGLPSVSAACCSEPCNCSLIKDVQTGLVWATKILTDPFHDIKLYHKAPLALLRGELIDPGIRAEWDEEEAEEAPHLT